MDLSILKERRKALGKKQYVFAKETGITQTYLSQIERGYKEPTLPVLDRLMDGLGLELRILIK